MNAHWNPYAAFGPGGRRDAAHSTHWFRQAWRRIALILRGSSRINPRLRSLGLPPLRHPGRLGWARPVLVWTPQVEGAPSVSGNAPADYWPGARYVDWVGTDFYSRFPNFAGLERFYDRWRGKPFAFGEFGLWGADDAGFVTRFFRWVRAHPRTRLVVYFPGAERGGPFDLARFPAGRAAMRRATR